MSSGIKMKDRQGNSAKFIGYFLSFLLIIQLSGMVSAWPSGIFGSAKITAGGSNTLIVAWQDTRSDRLRVGSPFRPFSPEVLRQTNGVALGLSSLIRDGRRTESPKTIASPMSRRGSISAIPAMLSGITDLTADWSCSLVSRRAMKLLHWLKMVLLTSEGRWLTTRSEKPYFLLSFAIRSNVSRARFEAASASDRTGK